MKTRKYRTNTEGEGTIIQKIDGKEVRVCGKRCFAKRKNAATHAKSESKRLGREMVYYRCSSCHSLHVGSKPGWREAHDAGPSTLHRRYLEESQEGDNR